MVLAKIVSQLDPATLAMMENNIARSSYHRHLSIEVQIGGLSVVALLALLLLVNVNFVDGLSSTPTKPSSHGHHDVIIIGGSFAGLSTSLTLGRSNDDVLIIDSNMPCNIDQPLSYNLLTQDGIPPSQLLEQAKSDVMKYPTISWMDGYVTNIQNKMDDDDGSSSSSSSMQTTLFQVQVNVNDSIVDESIKEESSDTNKVQHQQQEVAQTYTCNKLVLATGVRDVLPDHIPGLRDCWGKSLLHCPYW